MHRKKLAGHPMCLLCQGDRGTLFHRSFKCPAHAMFRTTMPPLVGHLARNMESEPEGAQELFARALFPDPSVLVPWKHHSPEVRVNWVNNRRPPDGYMSGLIFTDGSGLFGQHPQLRRSGWAIIQVDRFWDLEYGALGL